MREFKFRYIFEDIKEDGRTLVTQIWNLNDIEINDIVYDTEVLIARNQYTGLKDKNDVEIYEDDVIDYDGEIAKVTYENIMASFCVGGNSFDSSEAKYMKIIGNLYENPELLREGN